MKSRFKLAIGASFVLLLAAVLLFETSCMQSNAAKAPTSETGVNPGVISELANIGFDNSVSVTTLKNEEKRKLWAGKGLKYLSQQEVDAFVTENEFVIGPNSAYIGTITQQAANEIVKNYKFVMRHRMYPVPDGNIITPEYYNRLKKEDNKTYMWIKNHNNGLDDIYVIAPLTKFDVSKLTLDGRTLKPTNPDPVAIISDGMGGWLELARW